MKVIKVQSADEIAAIESLANEIWHEHFTPIIGTEQVEYMLEKYQSSLVIRQQINSGHIYLLVQREGRNIGYASFLTDSSRDAIQLSKFYLLNEQRGQGIGRRLMEHIETTCHQQHIHRIWLTVNRHNNGPITAYKKMGFTQIDEVIQDIGNGYVMDDFIMEKRLSSAA